MAELPQFMLVHTVDVDPYRGDSGDDDTYGPTETVPCNRQGELVLAADGQRSGEVHIFARLEHAGVLALDSRVRWETAGGAVQSGHIQARAEHDDAGLGGWQHVEVTVR